MKIWLNVIGYELVWLAAVWGAAHDLPWLGAFALIPFALWYLSRPDGRADRWLFLVVLLAGSCLDSIYAASGLIRYVSPVPSVHAAPIWIIAIWGAFALTLRHSFRFLHGRPWLAALLGALGAPLAYLGAGRLGHAVQFAHGELAAMVALALGWAVALPAMLAFAVAMERSRPSDIHGSAAHVD